MSALLLDTTFLIDCERGRADLESMIDDDDAAAIAAVTAAELLIGIHLATGERRARRQAYVDAIISAVPVLPYDLDVATAHARLLAETRHASRARGAHDLIIAATARASNRTVVTADPAGFEGLSGVRIKSYR